MLKTKFKIALGLASAGIVSLVVRKRFFNSKNIEEEKELETLEEVNDIHQSFDEMSESDLIQELLFLTMTEQKEKAMILAKFLKENFDGLSDPNRPPEETKPKKPNLKIIDGSKMEEDLPPEIA